MANDSGDIGVSLRLQNGTYEIAVKPYRKRVVIGAPVTITWKALRPNTTFPDNPVTWKIGNPGVVQKVNDTTLQLTYIPTEVAVYEYSIAITDNAVSPPVTIAMDPEVDNDVPPFEPYKDKGRDKDKN